MNSNMKWKILSGLCLFMIIGIFSSGCFGEDDDEKEAGIPKIVLITHSPEIPEPGEEITITAIVENSDGCMFTFNSYFATEASGGGLNMELIEKGKYEYTIDGPFEDGTEIWCIIIAQPGGNSEIVSSEYIIQIGNVERSDISTLSITNVKHSPQDPTTDTESVEVSADISSDVNISFVKLTRIVFELDHCSGGFRDKTWDRVNPYQISIDVKSKDYPTGSQVFYKIIVEDESGNTAVSSLSSFEIS